MSASCIVASYTAVHKSQRISTLPLLYGVCIVHIQQPQGLETIRHARYSHSILFGLRDLCF
ncbi:hypothetical protein BVRB_2g035640 [Beta vulgaris subsp. vulgaris]|nr:hypothetical protein BVRB_2g035640 [Beta vulgaris subsp. vulgaris]